MKQELTGTVRIYLGASATGISWSASGSNVNVYMNDDLLAIVEGITTGDLTHSGDYLI